MNINPKIFSNYKITIPRNKEEERDMLSNVFGYCAFLAREEMCMIQGLLLKSLSPELRIGVDRVITTLDNIEEFLADPDYFQDWK